MFLALGSIAQYVAPQYGIPIALVVAGAGFIIMRNADKKEIDTNAVLDNSTRRPPLAPKKRLTSKERWTINDLSEKMLYQHGHSDEDGMTRDRLDGFTWAQIINMPCHSCRKLRNEEGD